MEQLVARRAHNPKVVGSSPTPATKNKASIKILRLFLFLKVYCVSRLTTVEKGGGILKRLCKIQPLFFYIILSLHNVNNLCCYIL